MKPVAELKRAVARRLSLWALASVVAGGILLSVQDSPFLLGFAIQTVCWGVIDGVIALLAGRSSSRSGEGENREAGRFRRVLLINTGLNVCYVCAGFVLLFWIGGNRPAVAGHGAGVIVQGVFLLVFDYLHARLLATGRR